MPVLASALFCALAFNLTFFWQELWLVLPKAAAGLHPTLFHNDHDWSVRAPIAELLQGGGAIATLVSGLAFLPFAGRRLFFFWMAFEGLFQSMSQLVIGTQLPGNDMGRALAYLGVGETGRIGLLVLAVTAMLAAGVALARQRPPLGECLIAGLATIALAVPFRLPRNIVEVLLIPAIVQLGGLVFLALGACLIRSRRPDAVERPMAPAVALLMVLAIFQLVLRPGISFG